MNVIVTGACGFIGHHLVEHLIRKTTWNIIIIDKLNYASFGLDRIKDAGFINHPRVKIITWDLCTPFTPGIKHELGEVNMIIHMAAETHVDNSISDPVPFIKNNIDSTVNLLEYARTCKNLKNFIYFSTDEVFGNAPKGHSYKEWDSHHPTNPYSASKSASEMICLSYENTYKIPLMILNFMNAFGERQHCEKFIPKVIKSILENKIIDIHTYPDGQTPGSRFYIHARNIASAVLFIIENGKSGEKYNVIGEKEVNNLEMAQMIAKIMGGNPLNYNLVDFHTDRPGHDVRYALDGSKLISMGWKVPVSFEDSLRQTVEWTLRNKRWLNDINDM